MKSQNWKTTTSSGIKAAIQLNGFNQAYLSFYRKIKDEILSVDGIGMASHFYEMYEQALKNSRKFSESPVVFDQHLEVARFYRKIAHNIYWEQRAKDLISEDTRFIQSI